MHIEDIMKTKFTNGIFSSFNV